MNWTMKSRMFEKQFVCEIGWLCYSEFYRDIIQRHPYVYNFSSLHHRQRRDVQIKWKSFSYLSLWLLNKAAARQAGWHACQPANFQAVSGRRPAAGHCMPCYHHQRQQKLKAVTRKCNNEFTSLENYNFCGSLRRERMVAHAMISWSSQSTKKCFYCEVSTNFLFEFTTQRSSTAYSVSFFLTSLFSHLPPSSYQLLTKNAHWCYFFV